jgi:hypothetical protein
MTKISVERISAVSDRVKYQLRSLFLLMFIFVNQLQTMPMNYLFIYFSQFQQWKIGYNLLLDKKEN